MRIDNLLETLDRIAPEKSQESWDNSGIQILVNDNTEKILIALEITEDVIEEAKSVGADMIITHHPLIMSKFDPLDSVSKDTPRGRYIIELIKSGISLYSTHTPFDMAQDGNNEYLAEGIGLKEIRGFVKEDGSTDMIGRIGVFEKPVSLGELTERLSSFLNTDSIRTTGSPDEMISTAGIVTGAGAGLLELAYENLCDAFITGDVKYHDAQNARALGMTLIDAGHFETENTFAQNYAGILSGKLGSSGPEIIPSKLNIDPFIY